MFRIIAIFVLAMFGALTITAEIVNACKAAGRPQVALALAVALPLLGTALAFWNAAKSTVALVDAEFANSK